MTDDAYDYLVGWVATEQDWINIEYVERAMRALKRAGFTPIELACAQNALDREFGL
jgi:hypothetical protein